MKITEEILDREIERLNEKIQLAKAELYQYYIIKKNYAEIKIGDKVIYSDWRCLRTSPKNPKTKNGIIIDVSFSYKRGFCYKILPYKNDWSIKSNRVISLYTSFNHTKRGIINNYKSEL